LEIRGILWLKHICKEEIILKGTLRGDPREKKKGAGAVGKGSRKALRQGRGWGGEGVRGSEKLDGLRLGRGRLFLENAVGDGCGCQQNLEAAEACASCGKGTSQAAATGMTSLGESG